MGEVSKDDDDDDDDDLKDATGGPRISRNQGLRRPLVGSSRELPMDAGRSSYGVS